MPGANAVQVQVTDEGDLSMLEDLPEVVQVTSAEANQKAAARQALTEVWQPFVVSHGEISPQATDPSIYVDEMFDEVYGYTYPYTPVTVVLKDSSDSVKETAYDTADYEGYYFVSFYYANVEPGDVVEVTADSNFASLTVDALTGQVDPINDRVTGTAPVGRVHQRLGQLQRDVPRRLEHRQRGLRTDLCL
jgi:hypothetical protein